jgi:hypothetical protein
VGVLPSLLNPPLLLISVSNTFIFLKLNNFKKGVILSVLGILVSIIIFILLYFLLKPLPPIWYTKGEVVNFDLYFNWYTSPEHFLDPTAILNVITSFIFFSVISPAQELSKSLNFIEYFPKYFDSVIGTILILFYIGCLCVFSFYIVKNRDIIRDCAIILFSCLLLFYIYFNPQEAILYSCQITFILTLLFSDITNRIDLKKKNFYLSLFILFLFINNIRTLYHPL